MLVALQSAAGSRFAAWAEAAQARAHCATVRLVYASDSRHPKHEGCRMYSGQRHVAEARDVFCMFRHEDLAWQPGPTALGCPCCPDAICRGDCSAAARGVLCRASKDCSPAQDPTCSASSTAIFSSLLMAPLLPFCAALASSWRNPFSRFHIAGRLRDGKAFQLPCLASLQVAPGYLHATEGLSAQPLSSLGSED